MTTIEQVEDRIREFFEENYELMRYEAGHDIAADIKEMALQQVLLYWKKLHEIASSVTETEVKLALPEQRSAEGRKFTIEGVVDIVREEDETWMYDIKTHDLDYILNNKELYEQQLNIYAHIWHGLRGNPLDHTAIISTSFPGTLRDALKGGNAKQIEYEMQRWKPVVEIPLNQRHLEELVADFGRTVDNIENSCFSPRPVSELKERPTGGKSKEIFATRVCRNCDARFSCSSYREFAAQSQGKNLYHFRQFWLEAGMEAELDDWLNANLTDTSQIDRASRTADEL